MKKKKKKKEKETEHEYFYLLSSFIFFLQFSFYFEEKTCQWIWRENTKTSLFIFLPFYLPKYPNTLKKNFLLIFFSKFPNHLFHLHTKLELEHKRPTQNTRHEKQKGQEKIKVALSHELGHTLSYSTTAFACGINL